MLGGPVHIGEFGDSPELSVSLLALIREGRKRAGTGLLWAYEAEDESIEQMGEIEIVVDHRNEPALITRFTQAQVVIYGEVSWAAYAKDGTQRSRQL